MTLTERTHIARRFWSKVGMGEGCWEWRGVIDRYGYGLVRGLVKVNGQRRMAGAHRVAQELTRGLIPTGLCVLHRCDNRACVRPSHLFLGTHADNARDRDAKNRHRALSGEASGMAKLTAVQVRQMRDLATESQASPRELAQRFGVGDTTVRHVLARRTWRSLP
jgi:hypothetical protein